MIWGPINELRLGFTDAFKFYQLTFVQIVLFSGIMGNKDTGDMEPILQEILTGYCKE